MRCRVLIEHDPETKSVTATVAGLPVVAGARSEKEALRLVKEGISLYLAEDPEAKRRGERGLVRARLVKVNVE